MNFTRKSGVLLHPTSLPGPDGIGDLGPSAYHWLDFLESAGCKLWQILPLGPTGFGDSPYQCFSAFAGNPLLISAIPLLDKGLLSRENMLDRPDFSANQVDYGQVIEWKNRVLDRAFLNFRKSRSKTLRKEYNQFCDSNNDWLNSFSLFMSIKEIQGGSSWETWPSLLRSRDPLSLQNFSQDHTIEIEKHKFRQFLFFDQWLKVKQYASKKDIQIIGDIPIFIAFDSADAWANPDLFFLDKDSKPTVVAGVPPDYFSPTGQLWGNPLYRWAAHKKQGYKWWIDRLKAVFQVVDYVRLDHFRGFAGYWEIPFGYPTAEIGRWVKGPGSSFLSAIEKAFSGLPIIAEDLGLITPDVIQLRDRFDLPGMKILQFAFSSTPLDPFLPHNYPVNCIAYTGTHDNDTILGWYNSAPEIERDFCRRYLACSGDDISWDMIRAIWRSVSIFAIAPLQDFLNLGPEARMNFPGRPSGNWDWRFKQEMLSDELAARIKELNYLYSR